MKNNKKLLLEAGSISVSTITPAAAKPTGTAAPAKPEQKKQSNSIMDSLGKLLPLILGLGGLSMLFGKGLFGIGGGKGGLFGGFWGKLIRRNCISYYFTQLME